MPPKAEAEKKRKAHEDAFSHLRDMLTCPRCSELMTGTVYQCPNHHNICPACKAKLAAPKKCPKCDNTNLDMRNVTLETLAANVPVQCPLPGCPEAVKVSQLHLHKAACIYGPMQCGKLLISEDECEFKANTAEELVAHLQAAHGDIVVCHDVGEGMGSNSKLISTGKLREGQGPRSDTDWIHVLRRNSQTHLVVVRRTGQAVGYGDFRFYVLQLAGPGVAVEKKATLQFVGPEMGDAKFAKAEAELRVMNLRAPAPEFSDDFEMFEDMPVELEGQLTDKQALKLHGHTGRGVVDEFPEGFCIRFRCIIG